MKFSEFNKLSKEEKKKVKFRDKPIGLKIALYFIIGIILLVVVSSIRDCSNGVIPPKSVPEVKKPTELDAHYFTEEAVKRLLKAPSTAKFGDYKCRISGDTIFYCTGYVDAQNSFGAMLRNNYHVILKYTGKDPDDITAWSIVDSGLE